MAICETCTKEHNGHYGTARKVCMECFAISKELTDPYRIRTAYCRTGRPKGTTEYDQAKADEQHTMTPKAHAFIKANKRLIEEMARKRYEVQWKLF